MDFGIDKDIVRVIKLDKYGLEVTLVNHLLTINLAGKEFKVTDYSKRNMKDIISNSDFDHMYTYTKILNKYGELGDFMESVENYFKNA